MNRKLSILAAGLFAAFTFSTAKAQVQDVSVTVSPYFSYNWWNENISLKNSPFYGARVGFGLGPFFEIRANAEKSLNVKHALEGKSWNILNEDALKKLDGMDIDITRVGGELKVNLLNGYTVAPYITAGAGVQVMDYNPFDAKTADGAFEDAKAKEKQLYWSAGLGMKVNLSDRIALALEGRNVRFNMDANNSFINPATANENKKWGNWQAVASLDFYLGGNSLANTPEARQYRSLYSDGFRGVKFVLEPGVKYVDFNDKLPLKDQWFMGGAAGIDFSSLVGIRAYYYQATKEPNKLSFDFNKDYRMYGADLIARLNVPRGIVPYLQLGAGYLDDKNLILAGNEGEAEERFDTHNLYAQLGAGIEIPMSRWFALFGTVNSMLMTDRLSGVKIQDINKPSDIVSNISYTAGLRINVGRPAYAPSYSSIDDVDNGSINQSRARRDIFGRDVYINSKNMMTKQEFEDMVDRIMEKIRSEESARASLFTQDEMNVVLTALNTQNAREGKAAVSSSTTDAEAIADLRARINRLENQSGRSATTPTTTIIAPGTGYTTPSAPAQTMTQPAETSDPQAVYSTSNKSGAVDSYLKLNRLAVLGGINLGEGTQGMLGVRGYLQISDTNFDFVPELMAGFGGNKTGYALSGNVIYNIVLDNSRFTPYAGLGLGVFNNGLGASFGSNIILGTSFKMDKKGEFFADYSARTLFKNNQIAVGYRFVF